jgi:hypothetical protein
MITRSRHGSQASSKEVGINQEAHFASEEEEGNRASAETEAAEAQDRTGVQTGAETEARAQKDGDEEEGRETWGLAVALSR